jgi:hypothetical protein
MIVQAIAEVGLEGGLDRLAEGVDLDGLPGLLQPRRHLAAAAAQDLVQPRSGSGRAEVR